MAQAARGDISKVDWSGFDLIYLFQGPESMPHSIEKAGAELKPGNWLESLELEALGLTPAVKLEGTQGKLVWIYQTPVLE